MARYEDEYVSKFTEEGAERVKSQMRGIGDAGSRMGNFKEAAGEAFAFLGPRIAALGERLDTLSTDWARQYREASAVQARLESLGKAQGWTDEQIANVERMSGALMMKSGFDDDAIKQEAVAMANFGMSAQQIEQILPGLVRQARTMNQPITGMGAAMGKAFGSGNLGALKRMGVTIDDQSFALWKAQSAATNWGDAQQVAALRALVLQGAIKGIDATAVPLEEILNSSAARAELFDQKMANVHETLGEGANSVLEWRRQLLGMGIDLAATNPELTRFLGGAAAVAGPVIKGAGAIGTFAHDWVGFAASLKLMKSGKDALKVATEGEALAEKAKIGIAGKEAQALKGVGDQVTKNVGLLGKLGLATSGGMGWGMNGIMGGFTTMGGAGSGMSAASVLSGGAGLGAALASGVVVAAAAAVAAVLIARDVKVIQETQKELGNVDTGNEGLRQQWQQGQQAGLTGQVQETKRHTYWQNMWASMHGDWSEEDTTSVRTTPGGRRTTTTPTGDLRVTIPGDQVVTSQRVEDHARLR